MKNFLLLSLSALLLVLNSCTSGQTQSIKTNLTPTEFDAKIKELPTAPIVDVRSPEEFAKGHIQNSININWNGDDFNYQTSKLDKTKPVLVYCLSGGRSAAAASQLRADGFAMVYELGGGMMKWRNANLPETTTNASASTGMTKPQFDLLLNTDKLLLIDFYADWCAPCKKMKPYLEEISKEMSDKVLVLRINADENAALCKELNVSDLPVLQLYKNKAMIWNNIGFIEKSEVVKKLK